VRKIVEAFEEAVANEVGGRQIAGFERVMNAIGEVTSIEIRNEPRSKADHRRE